MRRTFLSLDRSETAATDYVEPDRYRHLKTSFADGPVIARGGGLSYVAASFAENARSVGMCHFNRILAFSREDLWIEVEAGITLERLFEFLAPMGLGLRIQPGYPHITIGGCVAGNVHGKNQYREGTFKAQILRVRLFHPDHGEIELNPGDALFDLTVGGLGLTGAILSVRLSLAELPAGSMAIEHREVGSLAEAAAEIDRAKDTLDLAYGWIDLSRPARSGEPGYLVFGRYERSGETPRLAPSRAMNPSAAKFRPNVLRDELLPLINRVYLELGRRNNRRVQPLSNCLFPAVGKEFYFDWFGKDGFIEMQMLVPSDTLPAWIAEARRAIADVRQPIALTTIKRFSGRRSFLNFDGEGFVISFDVSGPHCRPLFGALDEINSSLGCLSNVLKDSRLSAESVRRQYGAGYSEFRERLHAFDPRRRFVSRLSERLKL